MPYTATSPLPPVRHDISGHEVVPGIVVLYDENHYAENTIRLPAEMIDYLVLLDGERTVEFFVQQAARIRRAFSVDDFLAVIDILDREHFLDSPVFHARKEEMDREFNQSTVRPTVHAGVSYPDDPDELRKMLDGFLAAGPYTGNGAPPVAVIAPHIDFRVGGESYGCRHTTRCASPTPTRSSSSVFRTR